MKKTYATSMPDHIGAFLKASQCFAALGVNITRVSYNKAVDSHMLFIDAEGTPEQLKAADAQLEQIGYLQHDTKKTSIVLIEFTLRDVPGSVTDVLTLIRDFNFNISYISSQENGTDYQYFKMGLYVEDFDRIERFLQEAEQICQVRVIDYNSMEKVYDNSIFYNNYVQGLSQTMELSKDVSQALLVHVNLAMQTLDEQGLSPYRTFDNIRKFADLLKASKGSAFAPRISTHFVGEDTVITLIEPPCGSNTMVLQSKGEVLFIDSGYACYQEEMLSIFRRILPNFAQLRKKILVTHADVDHCGLLPLFDEIIASAKTAHCLACEYAGEDGYREQNPLHKPYIHICKILTSYQPANPETITVPWEDVPHLESPLTSIGVFDVGELHFDVYEGQGGHLPGEIVLLDTAHHLAITGDVYINVHGLTPEQAAYNQYAPILMTSVDTDPKCCALERQAILDHLTPGKWQIFGAHGFKKEISV